MKALRVVSGKTEQRYTPCEHIRKMSATEKSIYGHLMYCPICGQRIIDQVPIPLCPKCGLRVPERVKFCPYCGQKLSWRGFPTRR